MKEKETITPGAFGKIAGQAMHKKKLTLSEELLAKRAKLDRIRSSVSAGTYEVTPEQVAERLIAKASEVLRTHGRLRS